MCIPCIDAKRKYFLLSLSRSNLGEQCKERLSILQQVASNCCRGVNMIKRHRIWRDCYLGWRSLRVMFLRWGLPRCLPRGRHWKLECCNFWWFFPLWWTWVQKSVGQIGLSCFLKKGQINLNNGRKTCVVHGVYVGISNDC
jgi:hypothetical protein